MSDPARVLCVDDEPLVLDSLSRILGLEFDVRTAEGPRLGLESLETAGPFAVVISDMRMPHMDGAAFLAEVRRRAPYSVRVLLTGQSDLDAAVNAVNGGQVFRFLQKPCPPERLRAAVLAAIEQHRLLTAEHELLEHTLHGAVRVLAQVLELVNPLAFGRSMRVVGYVRHIARRLGVSASWRVEVAAMLSHIGCVALPADLLARVYASQELSPEESARFAQHPQVAGELLAGIPRLEPVIEIIRRQNGDPAGKPDALASEAQILRLGLLLDRRLTAGQSLSQVVEELRRQPGEFKPRLVASLAGLEEPLDRVVLRRVRVTSLMPGMTLDEDLRAKDGVLVAARGLVMTPTVIRWLRGMAEGDGLRNEFRVRERELARAA